MWVKKGANKNQNSKKLIIQNMLKIICTLFLILKFLYFINDFKKLSALTKPAKDPKGITYPMFSKFAQIKSH